MNKVKKIILMFIFLICLDASFACQITTSEDGPNSYSGDCAVEKFNNGDYSVMGPDDWKNPKVDMSGMKNEDVGEHISDIELAGRAGELKSAQLTGNLHSFDNLANLNTDELAGTMMSDEYGFQGGLKILDNSVNVRLIKGEYGEPDFIEVGGSSRIFQDTTADEFNVIPGGVKMIIACEKSDSTDPFELLFGNEGASETVVITEIETSIEIDGSEDITNPVERTWGDINTGKPAGNIDVIGADMEVSSNDANNVEVTKAKEVTYTPHANPEKPVYATNSENLKFGSQGMEVEKAEAIQSGDTTISNAVNAFVSNTGDVYLESAGVVNDFDSITIEPREYISNQVQFSVKSADSVEVGCYKYYNVSDARFNVENGNTIMELAEDNTVPIENCYENIFFFTAQSNESQITVIPGTPDILLIKAGMISYEDESVEINSTAMVLFDPITGVVCMEVNPPATYYKNDLDMRKDFAVYMYQDSYKLCFKKTISDNHAVPTTEYNYGLVDFLDNAAYLNGYAQYLRYPFSSTVTDLSYKNIYDGQLDDSKTIINLDNDGLFINTMNVVNNSGITSISNPAEYITIIEDHTTSWVKLSHKQILSNNIAHIYNLAAVKGNILSRGNTQIYPYRNVVMEDYIDSLNIKEENLGVFG